MKQFGEFILKSYFLPLLVLCIIVLPIAFQRYTLTDKMLANAYASELNSYGWVNNLDSVCGFVFGSSTLWYGVSSTAMKTTNAAWVNLSKSSRDPVVIELLLKRYYNPKRKPEYILVGLDPWVYSKRYYAGRHKIMYLDLNREETWNFLRMDRAIFITKFRQLCSSALFSDCGSSDTLNYKIPDDYGSCRFKQTGKRRFDSTRKDWFLLKKFHWSEMQFESLKRIKEFCHNNNVRLVFVIPPKAKEYTQFVKLNMDLEHKEWWKRINEVINGELVVGNYHCLDSLNPDSIFADGLHMNERGQQLFSLYLKGQITHPGKISEGYCFY